MTKIVYHVTISGKIEIDTNQLADWEISRDRRIKDPKKRSFDIDRYLELVANSLEVVHHHWKSKGFVVTKKTVYDKRGYPTDEPAKEGCC